MTKIMLLALVLLVGASRPGFGGQTDTLTIYVPALDTPSGCDTLDGWRDTRPVRLLIEARGSWRSWVFTYDLPYRPYVWKGRLTLPGGFYIRQSRVSDVGGVSCWSPHRSTIAKGW